MTAQKELRSGQRDLGIAVSREPRAREYRPLEQADKTMAAFNKQRDRIMQAPDLAATRRLVGSDPNTVDRLQRSGAWNDVGALKRALIDNVTARRNDFAKRTMQSMDTLRAIAAGRPAPVTRTIPSDPTQP